MSSLITDTTTTTTSNGTKWTPSDIFINVELSFVNTAGEVYNINVPNGIGIKWNQMSKALEETLKAKSLGVNGKASEPLMQCFQLSIKSVQLAKKPQKEASKQEIKALMAATPD